MMLTDKLLGRILIACALLAVLIATHSLLRLLHILPRW